MRKTIATAIAIALAIIIGVCIGRTTAIHQAEITEINDNGYYIDFGGEIHEYTF